MVVAPVTEAVAHPLLRPAAGGNNQGKLRDGAAGDPFDPGQGVAGACTGRILVAAAGRLAEERLLAAVDILDRGSCR